VLHAVRLVLLAGGIEPRPHVRLSHVMNIEQPDRVAAQPVGPIGDHALSRTAAGQRDDDQHAQQPHGDDANREQYLQQAHAARGTAGNHDLDTRPPENKKLVE
jgi:hypothetical protein